MFLRRPRSAMTPFPRTRPARTRSLDGFWSFGLLADDADPAAADPTAVDCREVAAVPGVYDAGPERPGHRGCVLYRTSVEVTPDTPSVLRFDGLGLWARLFVDGEALATYDLPYGGWTVRVPAAAHTRRRIEVLVDNRLHPERTPLVEPFFDFYLYGGIYRGVTLRELPEPAVLAARVTVLDRRSGSIRVAVEASAPPVEPLEASFDGGDFERVAGVIWDAATAAIELAVPDPRAWSPEAPELHTLTLRLGDDTFTTRFGLRDVRVDGPRLLLNDEPLKLRGVCRHEVHPQLGPALPGSLILQDVQHLRALGCNFVRGAHYPQDPRFLDLCDEHGLLVFEESLGWQARLENFENPRFAERVVQQTREMVRTSFNHPSVILWGFLNEGYADLPESRPVYEALAAAVRTEDGSRPLTYAVFKPFEDRNLDLVDVVSVNTYPGWYAEPAAGPRPLGEIVPRIDSILEHLAATGHGDKPFLLSEIGAGTLYGWHDPHRAHWSEEYQADLLAVVCEKFLGDDRIDGLAIWQFCDGRTYSDGHALGRPRAFNNKGLLDEYRRPKLAAAGVAAAFKGGGRAGSQ